MEHGEGDGWLRYNMAGPSDLLQAISLWSLTSRDTGLEARRVSNYGHGWLREVKEIVRRKLPKV